MHRIRGAARKFAGPGRIPAVILCLALVCAVATAVAQQDKKDEEGRYIDANGEPTYHIAPDGTVDWFTYSGYRRYHSECHVCHGPDGEGSSYAPPLVDAMKTLTYDQFREIVVNGKRDVGTGTANVVMPAFGENSNVMCYLDDIYVYLRARADGKLPRGRPDKHEDKPKEADETEKACFGQT
jgi:methanol metabolism-related c-type cytochrome